jgi:biopolymer transport protein ExbB
MPRLVRLPVLLGAVLLIPSFLCAAAAPEAASASSAASAGEAATNALSASAAETPGETGTAPAKEVTGFDQWVENVRMGGRTMIFIGLLSVLGLATALERFVNLRRGRVVPEGMAERVVALWREGRHEEVAALCRKSRSILARVVETLLEHRANSDVAQVKMFAEDKAGRELRLEHRKTQMLALVATLAPLLGLFGTVVGLLGAFQTVAAVGEMGDPSVLADDIAKALVTTVAGLIVAMPALFFHHLFRNRISLFGVMLEEEVCDLVNALFINNGGKSGQNEQQGRKG